MPSFSHRYKLDGPRPGPAPLDLRGNRKALADCGAAGAIRDTHIVHPIDGNSMDNIHGILQFCPFLGGKSSHDMVTLGLSRSSLIFMAGPLLLQCPYCNTKGKDRQ